MAHALCMLDNYGYRHTLRICNIYCFSTTTMVTRTRLNVHVYTYIASLVITMAGFKTDYISSQRLFKPINVN